MEYRDRLLLNPVSEAIDPAVFNTVEAGSCTVEQRAEQ